MSNKEAKSCIATLMLIYTIASEQGALDAIDRDNCKKMIKWLKEDMKEVENGADR